tara:strand:+ start:32992 stop:33153 length:162 start_codon:yes stop_codon:yes gene_type:complete
VDPWLHRPVIADPPLCTLKELQDGTYSIEDVLILNEILDVKNHLKPKEKRNAR